AVKTEEPVSVATEVKEELGSAALLAPITTDEDEEEEEDEDYVPGAGSDAEDGSDDGSESDGSESENSSSSSSDEEKEDQAKAKVDKGKGKVYEAEQEEESEDEDYDPTAKKRKRNSDSSSDSGGSSDSDSDSSGSSDSDSDSDGSDEDSENDEDYNPHSPARPNKKPRFFPPPPSEPLKTVTITQLLETWNPCRPGEIAWIPTSELNLPRTGCATKPAYWPVLVLDTPPSPSHAESPKAQVMPLPLPSPSTVSTLSKTSTALHFRPDLHRTPSHYSTPPPPLIFGPRQVNTETIIPWMKKSVDTFLKSGGEGVGFSKGLVQGVGLEVSWEVLEYLPSTEIVQEEELFADDPEERVQYLKKVRWGSEVVEVGDWVRVASSEGRRRSRVLPGRYVWGAKTQEGGRGLYISVKDDIDERGGDKIGIPD
ncbi:hypothetical protein HDV05_002072, partial [Chytridiales sp. JEL 0842]